MDETDRGKKRKKKTKNIQVIRFYSNTITF